MQRKLDALTKRLEAVEHPAVSSWDARFMFRWPDLAALDDAGVLALVQEDIERRASAAPGTLMFVAPGHLRANDARLVGDQARRHYTALAERATAILDGALYLPIAQADAQQARALLAAGDLVVATDVAGVAFGLAHRVSVNVRADDPPELWASMTLPYRIAAGLWALRDQLDMRPQWHVPWLLGMLDTIASWAASAEAI